jgi:chemosensory pili system protein ChpC
MTESAEELYSLLIPLDNMRLLLPRTCVAEVIGYHSPVPVEDCPHWFLGYLDWSGRAVPVVSFEAIDGGPVAEHGARSKVAILQGISGKLAIPFFGVVAQGFPQLVRVSRDVLRLDETVTFEGEDVKLCRLKMLNEQPVIPNLERIESMIRDALSKRVVSA